MNTLRNYSEFSIAIDEGFASQHKKLVSLNFKTTDKKKEREKKSPIIITSKDTMRVDDIIRKAGGDWNSKAEQLTRQMAAAITDGYKALRRGLAAEQENLTHMARIFFLRAGALGVNY